MEYYLLNQDAIVPFVFPVVTNEQQLFHYHINHEDQVLEEAKPAIYIRPKDLPILRFSTSPCEDMVNSINRFDLTHLGGEGLFIVSNRNRLRKLLNAFLFPLKFYYHPEPFSFEVEKRGNKIYFGPLDEQPGAINHEKTSIKGYGIPFEEAMTKREQENTKHFRFVSFTLLNTIQLMIRSEIDSVDETNPENYVEIKAKRIVGNSRYYSPYRDKEYMRNIWGQMFLGRATTLVLGQLADYHKGYVKIHKVYEHSYAQVKEMADVHIPSICRFASLLHWIQTNIQENEKKTLSYENGRFCYSSCL